MQPDGLPLLPSSLFQQGLARIEQQDWHGAEHYLSRVVELEPTYSPAWCRLGDVRLALEQREAAIEAWERGPFAPRCLESLGREVLEEDPGRAARAFETLHRRTSDPTVRLLQARALAAGSPHEARALIEDFLELRAETPPDLLPAVEAVVERLEPDEADALLQAVTHHSPALHEALAARMEELDVEQRALELMGAAPSALDAAQSASLAQARSLHAAGETTTALARAEKLANDAARSPEVWAVLADLREAVGDIEGAERALWLARRLDPLSPQLQVKHAAILQEHFGQRFAEEAFDALNQAVKVEPTPELRWRHARLALQVERFAEARVSLLALAGSGPDAAEARRLLAGLDRERAEPPILPALGPPEGVGEEAWLRTHRAQVWWERARRSTPLDEEQAARALQELDEALAQEPELLKALNLRAQVRWARGDQAGAKADWQASLARRRQPGVLARLAEVAHTEGRLDEAGRLLEEAAAAGSSVAMFRLAQRDAREGRWWAALERLDVYFGMASSGGVYDDALELQQSLWGKVRALAIALIATFLLLLLLPVLWYRRRRAGVSVATWLERRPRSFRDVARVVSAIRHEVLKHNISSLPMVADAVEVGDEEVAAWAAERLGAALEQLDRYLGELVQLARDQGVVLNLRRRDPTFGPILAAADRLERARHRLGQRKTAGELRAISQDLNDTAYRELGSLVTGVCVLRLDADLFEGVWAEVCREPSFVGRELPAFSAEVPPLAVRMFRSDLKDVLVNLLRNGLEASLAEGREALAVKVRTDEDLITGLLRAEIRVCDQVQKRLTTAMIRGRYIDRGLGLAVDLVSRAGGSVHVEHEDEWAKAVVIRLPMEEE